MYYNDLKIIIKVTCAYFIKITFYNRDWNSKSETSFGITCSKCSMKLLSDVIIEIGILEISSINFRVILILGLIWSGTW